MGEVLQCIKLDLKLILKRRNYGMLFCILPALLVSINNECFSVAHAIIILVISQLPFYLSGEINDLFSFIVPARDKSLVLGRYVYLICVNIVMTTLMFIIRFKFIPYYHASVYENILNSLIIGIICTIFCCINYTICFKERRGVNKDYIAITVMIISVLLEGLILVFTEENMELLINNFIVIPMLILSLICIGVLSYKISCSAYMRKDIL